MLAFIATASAFLAVGIAIGWLLRSRRVPPSSDHRAGRCGAPIGRGRTCQAWPAKGSDRCRSHPHEPKPAVAKDRLWRERADRPADEVAS